MSDFLPKNDAEFNTWQNDLLVYANNPNNMTRWGITAATVTPVNAEQAIWEDKYLNMLETKGIAETAMTGKIDSRLGFEPAIRGFVGQLQSNPDVNDEDRRAMKITIADTTRTPVGVPTDAPDGEVDVSMRLRHTINFWDSATPGVKAKPAGVRGAQVFMKIGGAAPVSPDECRYLATDTKTPYSHDFEMSEGGEMVYYLLCWENTKGDTGPWSRVLSARVPQN